MPDVNISNYWILFYIKSKEYRSELLQEYLKKHKNVVKFMRLEDKYSFIIEAIFSDKDDELMFVKNIKNNFSIDELTNFNIDDAKNQK